MYAWEEHGPTLNCQSTINSLRSFEPDVIFVLETLKLGPEILAVRPDAIYNFHSADPRYARGLNCDLWAIYHGQFPTVGCHRVVEALDSGEVLCIEGYRLRRGMTISQLRIEKVATAFRMATRLLTTARFARTDVVGDGRYYGAMPTILQDKVNDKLVKFTGGAT